VVGNEMPRNVSHQPSLVLHLLKFDSFPLNTGRVFRKGKANVFQPTIFRGELLVAGRVNPKNMALAIKERAIV